MYRIRTRHAAVASLVAAGLLFGIAGSASAEMLKDINSVNSIKNAKGQIKTGDDAYSFGQGLNTTGEISFDLANKTDAGVTIFGDDVNTLGNSSRPVNLQLALDGRLSGRNFNLTTEKQFDSGEAFTSFLLGQSDDFVSLDNGSLINNGSYSDITGATARIIDQTYSGTDHSIKTLTGGVLQFAGNSNFGQSDAGGDFSDGSGQISGYGTVDLTDIGNDNADDDNNGDSNGDSNDNGTVTDVPTPNGLGLALLALLGIGGLSAARRRQNRLSN